MDELPLRDYQLAACEAISAGWQRKPRQLLVLATGLGKTYTAAAMVRRRRSEGRTLWLAHRGELLDQARAALERVGLSVQIERAEERASQRPDASDVVVASVQTLHERRLLRWPKHSFATIVADECHRSTAPTWMRILDHFSTDARGRTTRVLGLTATPDRTDGVALGHVYDEAAYRYGIREGVRDGWLVPLAAPKTVVCEDLDLSQVKVIAGDLAAGELEEVVRRDEVLHQIAKPLVDLAGDRSTVIYTPGVDSAHGLARVMAGYVGADKVASLSGATPRDERAEVLRRFAAGEVQYLANCMLLTEGWDAPIASCIALARPSKSRSLIAQCIGRGTRILPGVVEGIETAEERRAAIAASDKPDLLVVDFTGRDRIDLVGPLDVLAGDELPDDVRRAADEIRERDPDKPLEDLLAEAEDLARNGEERRRQERLRARVKALVGYTTHEIDLAGFGEAHVELAEQAVATIRRNRKRPCRKCRGSGLNRAGTQCGYCRGSGRAGGNPRWEPEPTEKQKAFLLRHGIKLPQTAVRRQASAAIDLVIGSGLCTLGQAKVLRRAGFRTDLSKKEASEAIDALAQNGWRPTDEMYARWGQQP